MFNWHTSVEPPPQGTPVSARQQHQHQHQHQHQQHQQQQHQHPHQHPHQHQQHPQQQQSHHGPLQWLPAAPPLPRPLPNTLPPISALRPTNNFASTAQHDPVVMQTPASTDHSLSESPSIRENAVAENGVDLDPEPAYDHPAPGPEPSSDDVDIDGGSASRQAGRVGPGRGVDLALLENETPRKHGKRLTTREETALFEICNRHAASFGERNRLCEWWLNVTQEFTASEGHPYSWHSVRRKVELVTQQRIKFLAGLDGKRGDDQADAAWSAAVDSWIPSWKRFQGQENERINAKQGKRGRKRKSVVDAEGVGMGYQHMLPPGFDTMFPTSSKPTKATQMDPPASIPTTTAPLTTAEPAKAPPPQKQQKQQQQKQQQQQQHIPASVPLQPNAQQTPASNTAAMIAATSSSAAAAAAAAAATEPNVGAAILETLSKLNKNLEAATSRSHQSNAMSLATGAAHPHSHQQQKPSPNSSMANHTKSGHGHNHTHSRAAAGAASAATPVQNSIPASTLHQLKSELRAELRQEIQKDRAQLEEKLDSVQRTQEMILELLRQEPQ
ncbi:hypothetical protein AJ78_08964 [Emergomyces pasteurianus Ep9510]|uniref:Sex determining protein n=2 Tax=Emergomyces pasteurianus Ep9510 TaxID=1447872 RepID=A0A1J9NYM4_9EURO|nr:hypothetical protein AJ78_08964 [Emergomyces pasteurianus Ep9510]